MVSDLFFGWATAEDSMNRAEYMKEYQKTHRDSINAAWQRWRDRNPDKAKKLARKYYLARKRKNKANKWATRVELKVH